MFMIADTYNSLHGKVGPTRAHSYLLAASASHAGAGQQWLSTGRTRRLQPLQESVRPRIDGTASHRPQPVAVWRRVGHVCVHVQLSRHVREPKLQVELGQCVAHGFLDVAAPIAVVVRRKEKRRRMPSRRLAAEHVRVNQRLEVRSGAQALDRVGSGCIAAAGV